jgi:hypothetical protein
MGARALQEQALREQAGAGRVVQGQVGLAPLAGVLAVAAALRAVAALLRAVAALLRAAAAVRDAALQVAGVRKLATAFTVVRSRRSW